MTQPQPWKQSPRKVLPPEQQVAAGRTPAPKQQTATSTPGAGQRQWQAPPQKQSVQQEADNAQRPGGSTAAAKLPSRWRDGSDSDPDKCERHLPLIHEVDPVINLQPIDDEEPGFQFPTDPLAASRLKPDPEPALRADPVPEWGEGASAASNQSSETVAGTNAEAVTSAGSRATNCGWRASVAVYLMLLAFAAVAAPLELQWQT